MGWESDSPCHGHTCPGQWRWSPGRLSSWELAFRACGVKPGQGLLLTVERWSEGMWGWRLWWEMPVEENRAAMEARQYCWVKDRRWRHQHSLFSHTSISSWTLERLAHQMPDHWTTEQDPTQGAPLSAWCANLQSRTPPGCPFKCLMCQFTGRPPPPLARGVPLCVWRAEQQRRTPGNGPPLSAWMGRAMEKDWPKKLSDCQLRETWKKTLTGP